MAAIVHQGWVLKKRRKKMQGFARRYFTLYDSGVLSYSFEPAKPHRDQIQLQQATISTARNSRDIHVDSNTATFHMKCLGMEDFDVWMSAFRQFVAYSNDPRSLGRKSSMSRAQSRMGQVTKTSVLVDEMGVTIENLEHAIQDWRSGESLHRTGSKSRDKSREGSSKFGLFGKKSHQYPQSHPSTPTDEKESQLGDVYDRVIDSLNALKMEHAALAKLIASLSSVDLVGSPALPSVLPSTLEEGERAPTPKSVLPPSYRASMSGSVSDSASEWFDAPDGAEVHELDTEQDSQTPEGGASHMTRTNSQTSVSWVLEVAETEGSDTEDEEESPLKLDVVHEPFIPSHQIVRRTQLPSGPVGDEGSIFSVLKKNIGKARRILAQAFDLSNIALPVTFNEPLTLLQRAAEEVEYYDLLTQAARAEDPVERMCLIAAFAVSAYAHTRHRSSRKGFNPLLAETFEEPRLKFISEKVSHRPVVFAYHAEGEGWEAFATSSGKTKFWGKSLEIIPTGNNHVKIGTDHFEWCVKRPSSFMRNLMMGTKYLEHTGKMTIENMITKARCVVEFKENGYWELTNQVVGTVYSPSGKAQCTLEGNWDQSLSRKIDANHLFVLWRIIPFPKLAAAQYGFTQWAMTLNEITPDLVGNLPPTDSRYRPDVRALEEGRLDDSEREKERLEEAQRERRREGREREPRWFRQEGDEWFYKGGYWEQRAKGWKDVEPLW
ncbi:Oxysterol-binding protein-domain-containing protein [Vararia minispora EC-137]|uniref:Oxysterol-binding protein-domain-containing protein n=1 Tax=Vararia minispora EC-137 TaxID=1314806 RepID=A0ACB8QXY2_9AGAM|nr:Oxysterol-binding protein-domain-containing protein [Vararia minispora EC-137]